MENKQKIEISTLSFVKFFGVILVLILLYYIKDVLLLLFLVGIIVAALDPIVSMLYKKSIPRWLGALFLYLFILGMFVLAVYLIVPPIVEQVTNLAKNLPVYSQKLSPYYVNFTQVTKDWQQLLNSLSQELTNLTSSFYNATIIFLGGIASAVTVLVLSYYLLLEREGAKEFLLAIVPKQKQNYIFSLFKKITFKIGSWLRGQITVSLIMGFVTTTILAVAGVPYALTIGLIAACLEIIPIVGAIITGMLAVLFTFIAGGWVKAVIVLIVYLLVQQAESNILIPKIMGKATGLSPVIIITALLIGGELAGIPGAILAIPAASGLAILFEEWAKSKSH